MQETLNQGFAKMTNMALLQQQNSIYRLHTPKPPLLKSKHKAAKKRAEQAARYWSLKVFAKPFKSAAMA